MKTLSLLFLALAISGCASASNQTVAMYSDPPSAWRSLTTLDHGHAPGPAVLNNAYQDLEIEFSAPGYETQVVPLRSRFHFAFLLGGWWFMYDEEVRVKLRPTAVTSEEATGGAK